MHNLIHDWEWQALAGEYLFGHVDDDEGDAQINAMRLAIYVSAEVPRCWDPDALELVYRGRTWTPVPDDAPYLDLEHLTNAWNEAGETPLRLQVSDLHHDHPVFNRVDNLQFRVWHDTAHVVEQLGFDIDSEVRLFGIQAKDLDRRAADGLFCESIYQLAAYVALGDYPDEQFVRTPGPVGRRVLERLVR